MGSKKRGQQYTDYQQYSLPAEHGLQRDWPAGAKAPARNRECHEGGAGHEGGLRRGEDEGDEADNGHETGDGGGEGEEGHEDEPRQEAGDEGDEGDEGEGDEDETIGDEGGEGREGEQHREAGDERGEDDENAHGGGVEHVEVGDTLTLSSGALAVRVRIAKATVCLQPPLAIRELGHDEVLVAGATLTTGKLCWGWLKTDAFKMKATS